MATSAKTTVVGLFIQNSLICLINCDIVMNEYDLNLSKLQVE